MKKLFTAHCFCKRKPAQSNFKKPLEGKSTLECGQIKREAGSVNVKSGETQLLIVQIFGIVMFGNLISAAFGF